MLKVLYRAVCRVKSFLAYGGMVFVGSGAFVAEGDTFYWNGMSAGNSRDKAVIGDQYACWTNTTQTTPVAATDGNEYILRSTSTVSPQTVSGKGFTFPGERLVVGGSLALGDHTVSTSPSIQMKTIGNVSWRDRTVDSVFMSIKDIHWCRGSIRGKAGSTSGDLETRRAYCTGFSGRLEVFSTGIEPEYHQLGPADSDNYGPRNLMLASNLVSAEGVVIEGVGKNAQGVEESLGGARVYLMGDNTAYKGSFKASEWLTFSLIADDALGDPGTPNAAALQLGTNGGFEIHPAVRLGTTRGVTLLDGATGAYQTTHLATDCVTNRLAITGAGVPFRTIGPGTIRYAGAYSAGDWTVESGTLELMSEATFPLNQRFVVKAGATLVLASVHNGLHVDCEEGGTLVHGKIPYDNATATAIPTDFTVSGLPPLPIRIELSECVRREDAVRFAVVKLPANAEVTPADFTLDLNSVDNPLVATFEVVPGVDCVTIYLNVTPSVVFTSEAVASKKTYVLTDTEYIDLAGGVRAYMWSDHQKAHDEADYLITNGAPCTAASGWNDTMTFPGDTLAVRGPGQISTRHKRAVFKRIFFGPGAVFKGIGCGWGDTPHWLQGEVMIGGTVENPVSFQSRWASDLNKGKLDYAKNTTCIDGPLLGDGYLCFDGDSLADVRITSTNEAFKGGIFLETKADAITNCSLAVRHPYTLGGPLPTNQTNYHALVLGGVYATLKPLESMTLQTSGRGILVKDVTSGFDTPEGVTLTVLEPIRSVAGVTKRGSGTLALGGGWYLGENGKGTDDGATTSFRLMDGRLKVVDGVTVKGTKVFVDGTVSLVVDASATDPVVREYGFFNTNPSSWQIAAGQIVNVELEGAAALRQSGASTLCVPICTVSNEGDGSGTQAADRLRGCLKLLRVPGYKEKIVEDVPAAHQNMIRFAAVYERKGLMILFR